MTIPTILRTRLAAFAFILALAAPAAFAQSTLYWSGGTTDITGPLAIPTNYSSLTGIWDGTTKNFATDTNGTTYAAWSNGAVFSGFWAGFTANSQYSYVNLTNADPTVSGISIQIDRGTTSANIFAMMNSTNAVRTLTLNPGTVIDVRGVGANASQSGGADTIGLWIGYNNTNVTLAGTGGFTKTGNYDLEIDGNTHSNLTGTVNLLHDAKSINNNAAGILDINAAGGLVGITRFNLSASGYGTGTGTNLGLITAMKFASATNKNGLNDAAVINLDGLGSFAFTGATNTTETIGTLRLGSSGQLDLSGNGNTGTLAITNGILRANNRAQLFVKLTTGNTNGSTVNLGSNHGLGTDVLVPWIAEGTSGRFGMADASNNLTWASPTDLTSDVSSMTSSSANYRILGNATAFGANTNLPSGAAANTLAFYRSNAVSPVTIRITDSLTIAGGGIVNANGGANSDATLTGTNGTYLTTAANAPLYIFGAANNAGGGTLNLDVTITGDIDVVKTGFGVVKFGGTNQANNYTGTTYVNGGVLVLGKNSGVTALPGNAVVRSGGTIDWDQTDVVANTATITVEKGGYLKTDASTETVAGLAGGGMLVSTVTTVTNSFTVNSSVAPGDSGVGSMILSLGSTGGTNSFFRMNTNAAFTMELTAASGLTGDRVDFFNYNVGEFLLVGSNNINLTLLGTKTPGTYTNTIFRFYSDNGSSLTNSTISSGLSIGTWSGSDFASIPTITYNGSSIDLTYEVVPEPSTLAMLGLAGLAAIGYRIRRNRRA